MSALHYDAFGGFPASHLSLLPLSTRKDLLYQLPVADICLQLENTDFITGLDMAAFWKSTWEDEGIGVAEDSDVEGYFQVWDSAEYTRSMLYGLVATMAIGDLRGGEYWFHSPHYRYRKCPDGLPDSGIPVFSLLYAIRKPNHDIIHSGCELMFPPRYSHKSNKRDKDLTVSEVVNCFSHSKEELPRIFPEIEILNINGISLDHVYILRNAVYVGIQGYPLSEGLEFLKAILQEATNLEVLLLDHWGEDNKWEMKFLDEICAYLSSCWIFLYNFYLKLFLHRSQNLMGSLFHERI